VIILVTTASLSPSSSASSAMIFLLRSARAAGRVAALSGLEGHVFSSVVELNRKR
jgi:hypothetical protein